MIYLYTFDIKLRNFFLITKKKMSESDRSQGLLSEDSRLITEEDERQIEELLKSRSIYDLDRISEELSKELVKLETYNINMLIKSHDSIKEIWTGLSIAQEQLMAIAKDNDSLQLELNAISHIFEQIEKKNNRMAIITRNQQKLLDELTKLINKITLDRETIHILETGGMEAGKSLEKTIKAAYALNDVIYHDIEGDLVKLKSVNQQMDIFLKLRNQFSKRVRTYIYTLFKNVSENMHGFKTKGLEIPSHTSAVHRPLMQYKDLIHWLRKFEVEQKKSQSKHDNQPIETSPTNEDPNVKYGPSVKDDYITHMSPVWKKELKHFFHYLRKSIIKERSEKLSFKIDFSFVEHLKLKNLGRKIGVTSKDKTETYSKANDPASESEWGDNSEESESDFDDEMSESYKSKRTKDKYNVIKAFKLGLQTLLVRIMEEQEFVQEYFQYQSNKDKELTDFLNELFEGLFDELYAIILRAFKINRFYCMSLWVEINTFFNEYKDKSAFISDLFEKCKETVRSLLEKYVEDQIKYIQETKPSSVKGMGILPHTKKVPTFIDRMEECGAASGPELSVPIYNKLIKAVYDWLLSLGEDEYTKLAVRFENFHHLYVQLKARNIPALQNFCNQAKEIYDESLSNYIKLLVNKRFSKVMTFFDGIDKLYKTIKPENIQFQRTHSNAEMSIRLSKFTIEYVEKGLMKEYKRINKDLSEETGLIPDIWNTLKNYFTEKYKHFEKIIQECYKEQKLSFTLEELEETYKMIETREI